MNPKKIVDMVFGDKPPTKHGAEPIELRVTRVQSRATLRRVDRVLKDFENFERDAREAR